MCNIAEENVGSVQIAITCFPLLLWTRCLCFLKINLRHVFAMRIALFLEKAFNLQGALILDWACKMHSPVGLGL